MAENESFLSRLKNAWNAFSGSSVQSNNQNVGFGSTRNLGTHRPRPSTEKSMVNAIYNRIALDVASLTFKHVIIDEQGRYVSDVSSGLNNCLTVEANLDQTARTFIQDLVISMFDEGYVGAFPTDWESKTRWGDEFDILTMRSCKIIEWFPSHVRVDVYNQKTGKHVQLTVPKQHIAIIQNPLFAIINEPNATLKRLIRKLSLLDVIDEQSSSGKLNMIVQLPYSIKTETQKAQAEKRRADLESQLVNSKYGIAYTDGTEKVTQLNRPLENGLMDQVKYLMDLLYSQLGLTEDIMNGSANEIQMLNYMNRTIEPIAAAIVDEMKRKFLSEAARADGESVMFFNTPFKLVTTDGLVRLSDVLTRNEIMTSNEVRQALGLPPSDDPTADQLRNPALSEPNYGVDPNATGQNIIMEEGQDGSYLQ